RDQRQEKKKQSCARSAPLFVGSTPFTSRKVNNRSHLDHANKEVRNLATALYVHCERLFTFLEVKGVEPTNNGAERALRTAVQWRKICFGNRSRSGEIATARLLTVTQTCKRQQRHVLGYLTEAVRCHRRQIAAPSLLRRRI